MVVLIVLCLGVEFLCCHHLMCVFIFYVKFGRLGGTTYWENGCPLGLQYVF